MTSSVTLTKETFGSAFGAGEVPRAMVIEAKRAHSEQQRMVSNQHREGIQCRQDERGRQQTGKREAGESEEAEGEESSGTEHFDDCRIPFRPK